MTFSMHHSCHEILKPRQVLEMIKINVSLKATKSRNTKLHVTHKCAPIALIWHVDIWERTICQGLGKELFDKQRPVLNQIIC